MGAQKPPVPPEILKILCQIASSQTIEDDVSEAVCNEVTKLFPSIHFDPDCKTVVEELWDTGVALLCPSQPKGLAAAVPIPPAIEKMICEITGNKMIEDSTAELVCKEVKKLFPSIKFEPNCPTLFETLWDAGHMLLCKGKALQESTDQLVV